MSLLQYLDLGEERSIRAVAQKLAKSRQLVSQWSATYNWVERVAAWDDDLGRKAYEQAVKIARKMANRHISIVLKYLADAGSECA